MAVEGEEDLELLFAQPSIKTILFQKGAMGSGLPDMPLFEDNNPVGIHHCGETVRDDESRAPDEQL